jgi:hypothetical protein
MRKRLLRGTTYYVRPATVVALSDVFLRSAYNPEVQYSEPSTVLAGCLHTAEATANRAMGTQKAERYDTILRDFMSLKGGTKFAS